MFMGVPSFAGKVCPGPGVPGGRSYRRRRLRLEFQVEVRLLKDPRASGKSTIANFAGEIKSY
jgi:hypothetical protein